MCVVAEVVGVFLCVVAEVFGVFLRVVAEVCVRLTVAQIFAGFGGCFGGGS